MPTEVSLAEFEYFRAEAVPLDQVLKCGKLLLYVCLAENRDTLEVSNTTNTQLLDASAHAYGRVACNVSGLWAPLPDDPEDLKVHLDVGLEPYGALNNTLPVILKGYGDNKLCADTPNSTSNLYEVFHDIVVDHGFGNYQRVGRGIHMIDGYMLDGEKGDDVVRSMMASRGSQGGADGSAGVRVPTGPRSPVPAIPRRLEY